MRRPLVLLVALPLVTIGCRDRRPGEPIQAAKVTTPAAPPVAVAASPAPRPEVGPVDTDFRLVQLDPSVIGTTALCDVGRVEVRERAPAVLVSCDDRHRGSQIGLTVPDEILPSLTERTQIEVRIDAPGERGTGADALATFVRVTGELAPPEPKTACLCDRDRELAREAARPARPEGWDFALFQRARDRYWGTRQTCVISQVDEIGRSSPAAREYSVGRVFDPEQLPYAASVWCRSKSGSMQVDIGSTSAEVILDLAADQAVQIELGWSTAYNPGGKLVNVRWRPD